MEATTRMRAARHTSAVSRPPRKSRNVRVEDELWEAAQAAADEQKQVLAEQIRYFLADYVKAHKKGKRR